MIDACILGEQYNLLEYLIKDTRKGINNQREESQKVFVKYNIVSFLDLDYYWKSREGKDDVANNACHLAF